MLNYFHTSDSNPNQLKIKIYYNFETTECKLKIQKAKFVRIKFPTEPSNF